MADAPDVQPYLLDGLRQFFAVVDPRLADTLANLRSLLLSADSVSRKKALQELCCAYLSSFHFSFIRDLGHGLRRLGERPLTELDSLCGLAALREVPTFEDLLQAVFSADNSVISSIPTSTRYTLFLLRFNPHEAMNPLAGQVSTEIARLEAEGRSRQKILGDIAENACLAANVFEGLWSFLTLLLVEHCHSASSLEFGSRTWLVTDWVRAYLVYMLPVRSSDERAASLSEPFMSMWRRNLEAQRRKVHAHTMRLAVWVTVSQRHLRELAAKVQVGDEVIGNWLIRSLLLADRLLPIITHELYDRPEEMQNRIEEIELELGVSINPELYPDLFNPFLYGPLEYDHAVAALLALLNLTWDHLTGTDKAIPFWWSDAVRDALAVLAARPETEAETLLRTGRIQGKPNRLGVMVDRTPQEIAAEILERGMGQLS